MSDDRLQRGYGYEYLQKVASYTGWRYEYVYGTWDKLFEKLVNGEIDLMASIAYNKARSEEILYPDVKFLYYNSIELYIDAAKSCNADSTVVNSFRISQLINAKRNCWYHRWKFRTNVASAYCRKTQDCFAC